MVRLAALSTAIPRHLRWPADFPAALCDVRSRSNRSPAIRAGFGLNFHYNYGTVDQMATVECCEAGPCGLGIINPQQYEIRGNNIYTPTAMSSDFLPYSNWPKYQANRSHPSHARAYRSL